MRTGIRWLVEKDLYIVEKLFVDNLTKTMTNQHLQDVMYTKNCFARVMVNTSDDIPFAFGALSIYVVPSKGKVGTIEDLVVAENQTGHGFGTMLAKDLLDFAKLESLQFVSLTSNPAREAARHIYVKLGFTKLDTTTFRLYM